MSEHAVGGDSERKHYAKAEADLLPDHNTKHNQVFKLSEGRVIEKAEL